MPISEGDLILVTGATGFVAAHIIAQLLSRDYRVRGTVRSLSSPKSSFIQRRFEQYADRLELVQVANIEADDAFDEATRGVDGVVHTASPCYFDVQDAYDDLVKPAVRGTVSLLHSAHKNQRHVKSVVLTSSSATIMKPMPPGYVYTESDWNHEATEQLNTEYQSGGEVDGGNAYRASKTAAEMEAWQFMRQSKPQFELSTINPANIFGPVLHEIKDADSINLSVGVIFGYFTGNRREVVKNAPPQSFVDVRDVALMHIRALERTTAAGKRFIATSNTFTFQQLVDILRKAYPLQAKRIEQGSPGQNYTTQSRYDNSLAKEVLGVEFIDFERSVIDTVESLRQFSWLETYLEK